MTNEAVIIELQGAIPVSRICIDAIGIEKGTLLKLEDANKVSGANIARAPVFGGIAAAEKVASDTSTTLGCYMSGVFDLTTDAGTSVVVGTALVISGANLVAPALAADLLTGALVGYSEEIASGSEVIRVRLRG